MIPKQQRIIDPYADHRFSNTYSRSSRIITLGEDIILPHPTKNFNLEKDLDDSNELTLKIGPGFFIKDDIGVYIEEDYYVNFANQNFYYNNIISTTPGYYLITVHYVYTRSFPGPEARYYIIANTQVDNILELNESDPDNPKYDLKNNLLYLGTIEMVDNGEGGIKITNDDLSNKMSRYITNPGILDNQPVLLERKNYRFMPAIVDGGEEL